MKLTIEGNWQEIQVFCKNIDRLRRLDEKRASAGLDPATLAALTVLRAQGRRVGLIAAIAQYREVAFSETGEKPGLKDAKEAVEMLAMKYRIA